MPNHVLTDKELLKLYKYYYEHTEHIRELEASLEDEKMKAHNWRLMYEMEYNARNRLKEDYAKLKLKHKKASKIIAELKAENKELSRAYADLEDRFIKQRARLTELEDNKTTEYLEEMKETYKKG